MIITQTPFRVSFAGGGTDLASFYERRYGAVLSVTLNHHMYVTIHSRFDSNFRISYSKTEFADTVDGIGHDLVKQALIQTNNRSPLEITTIADVPAGTGLGSSSTLTVGLLNALYAYSGRITSPERLAQEACDIEINQLKSPIGKQDQYAAVGRGILIRFNPDGNVQVEPVPCSPACMQQIESHSMMVYTDSSRSANDILTRQKEGTADKLETLTKMRGLAEEIRSVILDGCNIQRFGELLHQGWELKRSLGFGISNPGIDEWYQKALEAGAYGGRLLGAGGGGFIYFLAPPDKHAQILHALGNPKTLSVSFDRVGSRIVFISDR
jgi:D-glycero-alpha-D-manno-heptose-7-phosphate kinase